MNITDICEISGDDLIIESLRKRFKENQIYVSLSMSLLMSLGLISQIIIIIYYKSNFPDFCCEGAYCYQPI